MSALDEKQCRRTFHLDRPDCRACAGYNTRCPDYEPAQAPPESDGDKRPASPAEMMGAAAGCRPVRARRTQLRFA